LFPKTDVLNYPGVSNIYLGEKVLSLQNDNGVNLALQNNPFGFYPSLIDCIAKKIKILGFRILKNLSIFCEITIFQVFKPKYYADQGSGAQTFPPVFSRLGDKSESTFF